MREDDQLAGGAPERPHLLEAGSGYPCLRATTVGLLLEAKLVLADTPTFTYWYSEPPEVERATGLEPATADLEGRGSTN